MMRSFQSNRKNSYVLASACLSVVASVSHAATATYDGGPSGTGNVLANPVNWDGDVLPANGDLIVIPKAPGSLNLNDSLTSGGGVPFTGTPPSKSFQSLTFGTDDTATTALPTTFSVFNSLDASFTANNTVRLTGDANGRVLNLAQGATQVGITLSASAAFGTATLELAGATSALNIINVATAASRISVNTWVLTGSHGYTKTGLGSLFVNSTANTISGDVFANAGLLGFGTSGALGLGTNTTFVADAATLSFDNVSTTGFTDTVAAGHGINLGGLTTRVTVGTLEQWTIGGPVGGTGALIKTGSGSLNLNGALTYTGGTTLTNGGLYINSALTVGTTLNAPAATTIGGLGTINGNIAVAGTLQPGSSSAVGTLTVNGNLALNIAGAAGRWAAGLSTTTTAVDGVNVSGAFDITGATLAVTNLNARGEAAIVLSNYGSLAGGSFASVTGLLGGYTLNYNYQGTNKIALVRGNTQLYYTGAASGDFGNAANFALNAAHTTASPDQYATASSDVYIDNGLALPNNSASYTGTTYVNSLTFSDSGTTGPTGFTISPSTGTPSLVIKATGINYTAGTGILVTGGTVTNTIAAPVIVGNSQSWTNNGAGTLAVTGTVNIGTNTLTLGGTGSTTLSGAISGSGTITAVGAGNVSLSGANTYTGTTTVNKTGGALVLSTAAQTVVLTGSGGADIRSGGLVFDGGDAATIRGLLAGSFTAATTPGVMDSGQLRSSTATAKRGLGYAVINGNQVLVKAAFFGDADLDGGVSINDFNALAGNFGQSTGKAWVDGDFDYDGGVSINDFNLLAGNFGLTLPAGSDGFAGLLAFAAAHNDLAAFEAVTGVPEPTSLGLIAAGATLGLRRRRRA